MIVIAGVKHYTIYFLIVNFDSSPLYYALQRSIRYFSDFVRYIPFRYDMHLVQYLAGLGEKKDISFVSLI